jgi:predicted dehydrogenase
MYKALLAGCGNIGAMYDWQNEHVLTHAKAYAASGVIETSFFDMKQEQAVKVAERYNGKVITDIDADLENTFYDLFSICTPTSTHFDLLKKAFQKKIPVIICEKPISLEPFELDQLADLYFSSGSKVLVNYFRRFQPSFEKLREIIEFLKETEKLTSISIRYQRGFINNCSHAFDLLQFLFQEKYSPDIFIVNRKVYDHFENDPTISGYGEWLYANLSILGLQDVKFTHFEIDLYFTQSKIQIQNSGNNIIFLSNADTPTDYSPLVIRNDLSMQNCISDYMVPVVRRAIDLLQNKGSDNFIEALKLNRTILNILIN